MCGSALLSRGYGGWDGASQPEICPLLILDQAHCCLVILPIRREGPGPFCTWKSAALALGAACDHRTMHMNLTHLRLKTMTLGKVKTPKSSTLSRTVFRFAWP